MTSHSVTNELPPIPRLDRPEAIRTEEGITTLRCYMVFMCKKHNLSVISPFQFDDMFNDAYAFLLERVDRWDPELSNFDTWATEMLRYGWLHAIRRMHWAGYRLIDTKHLIEGRNLTRFGVDEKGRTEQDIITDSSDEFGTLVEDIELEKMLSSLEPEDRRIVELLIEGFTPGEIARMYGSSVDKVRCSKLRVIEALGLERPPPARKYNELSEEDKAEVLKQHSKLGSYSLVSQRLGIQHRAVGKVVRNEA